MISIYDYIQESILDDMEDIEKDTDKSIKSSWFEQHATGKFKVKTTKKGTKITGDMIIKGFDGEEFPGFEVTEFDGNLTIEKCPNLKTMQGFFLNKKTSYVATYSIEGDLIINNCPKLIELNCPSTIKGDFHVVGNSSLKSLQYGPEMVYGNIYIMKNGKKFTKEQIKTAIPYIGDFVFCSEDEEYANVYESEELNEALNNPYLLMLAKQIKDNGGKFKAIFGGVEVAWDEVDSSHIKHYSWRFKSPSDKDLKAARQIISGKESGFIVLYKYVDNEIVFTKIINYNKRFLNINQDLKNRYLKFKDAKSTELVDMVIGKHYSETDGMIIISASRYNKELSTSEKTTARWQARQGIVQNTPEYYRKVARENMERYKKIIQANRANRSTGEVERVQKKVNDFLQRVMKASEIVMKNPLKYTEHLYYLESLNENAYSKISYDRGKSYGKDGVLVLFNRYMSTWGRAAGGKTHYGPDDLQGYLKSIEEHIDKIIKSAESYFNKFGV